MTRVKLTFNIIFDTDANDLDNMGEELALFLQETFHNGEDTFRVEYVESEIIS